MNLWLPIGMLTLTFGSTITPAQKQSERTQAREQFSMGLNAVSQRNFVEARKYFLVATQLAPQWGLVFLELALVEETIDSRSLLTHTYYQKAIEYEPHNARAHFQMGLFLEKRNEYQKAAQHFFKATELRPDMIDAYFHLGNSHQATQQFDQARKVFEKVTQMETHHTGAWTALAVLYENTGLLDQAEKALVTIIQSQPQLAYHHYQLAQFYERVGESKKANETFQHANSLNPRTQRKMRPLR